MKYFEKLLNHFGIKSTRQWRTLLDEAREQMDVFEEQTYDMNWHMERYKKELEEIRTEYELLTVANPVLAQARDDWMQEAKNWEKAYRTSAQRLSVNRLADLDIQQKMAIAMEMDEHRVQLEEELTKTNKKLHESELLRIGYYKEMRKLEAEIIGVKGACKLLKIESDALEDRLGTAMQYKPLYESCLATIKEMKKRDTRMV